MVDSLIRCCRACMHGKCTIYKWLFSVYRTVEQNRKSLFVWRNLSRAISFVPISWNEIYTKVNLFYWKSEYQTSHMAPIGRTIAVLQPSHLSHTTHVANPLCGQTYISNVFHTSVCCSWLGLIPDLTHKQGGVEMEVWKSFIGKHRPSATSNTFWMTQTRNASQALSANVSSRPHFCSCG